MKSLFILDLDALTYERSSTENGAFDGQPDQIARILPKKGKKELLYFCEDAKKPQLSGIHARGGDGNYYTILEGVDFPGDETTGLAFSPGYKYMYVSIQHAGIIFEVTREDNLPFGGDVINVKSYTAVQM
mmetsp:Transcript_474/g.632  ORF Transcript_474/g.632 Transcript_474/m.632 type:complete len:130 (-) Transcript_474:1014-1403(-)